MSLSLERQLKRLMLFRVVMLTTLLMVAIYIEAVSETLLRANPLYFLIAATYGLTLVHILMLRLVRLETVQVYVQVIGDLLMITGLIYLTGGIGRAGFILLYPISVLSGSVLLYRTKGLTLAGLATLFYAVLLWAVRIELIPAQALSDVRYLSAKHVVYSIFVTGVSCVTVTLIGSYLAESLRNVGEQLEQAEEHVADLQKLNNIIVDSIHSGLITADSRGQILYVNSYGAAILGRRPVEVLGQTLAELFASRGMERPALQARIADEHLARLELTHVKADGEETHLGLTLTRLVSSEPGGGSYLVVFQDLTEVKRLEQEVRMREKLAAVGEMAAHLAHEIRNPLGSISGSAQVLMAEANVSREQQELLAIITRESKRLSDALNQFLFQVRPATKPLGPVDLGQTIAEAVTLLRNGPEVGESHRVEFGRDDGPHVCLADPDQITQVFWNLARNGLEAMPDGGVLNVNVARHGEEMVLSVRDQGLGMPRREQWRLFEPLRSDGSVGTGLGLAIVYSIVREHSGDIRVRSTPSEGTEVEVRLPLVPVSLAV